MSEVTTENLKELKRIHKEVFKNFKYKTDKEQYGENEYWQAVPESFKPEDGLVGDCEDFAMACRKLCRDAGIENTRMLICWDETGGGHAVLECDGWVLDNRHRLVMSKRKLERIGYKWYAISGFNPGDPWTKVK